VGDSEQLSSIQIMGVLMSKPSLHILEDDSEIREDIERYAREIGFAVTASATLQEALEELKRQLFFDVLIIDIKIGADSEAGWKLLNRANSSGVKYTIIYSALVNDLKLPLEAAVGRGSFSVLRKPIDDDELKDKLKEIFEDLGIHLSKKIVRESAKDKEQIESIRWLAQTELPVLITGGTGVGKESLGREVAELSGRDKKLIRTINCGAFAESLLMSELFGHVKGSFTGADRNRLGLILETSGYVTDGTAGAFKRERGQFEPKPYHEWLSGKGRQLQEITAHNGELCYSVSKNVKGGTLILDEVAELSPEAQAALLRVLDGWPIKPVGYDGLGFLPNLRIIAITNDEEKLRTKECFRPDLLARLEGWHLIIEPLTERKETAEGIIHETISNVVFRDIRGNSVPRKFQIHSDALQDILDNLHSLDGGIRQLIWMVQRACTFAFMEAKTEVALEHLIKARKSGFLWKGEREEQSDSSNNVPAPASTTSANQQQVDLLREDIENFFKENGIQLRRHWDATTFKAKLKDLRSLPNSERNVGRLKEIVTEERPPAIYQAAFGKPTQKSNTVRKWFGSTNSKSRKE